MSIKSRLSILLIIHLALTIGCSGAGSQIERGDELRKAGLLGEALDAYKKAYRIDPDDEQLNVKIDAVETQLSQQSDSDGLMLLKSGDTLGAVHAFKQALEIKPEHEPYIKHLKKAALVHIAKGEKKLNEKKFKKAEAVFKEILKELPHLKRARQGIKDARLGMADGLLKKAVELQDRGLQGNALLELVSIRKLAGAYGDSADRELRARKELEEAAAFGIAIKPSKVKRKRLKQTAKLLQKLQNIRSPECNLVVGAGQPKATLKVGVRNIDFKNSRTMTSGEQKYQSGTRPVDNPEFLKLAKRIKDLRARVEELDQIITEDHKLVEQTRQAFADAGPSDDEESLRNRLRKAQKNLKMHTDEQQKKSDKALELRNKLSKTPRMLDEPVFDTHQYDIFEVTRTVTLTATLSAISENSQFLIRSKTVDGLAKTKDSTNKAEPKYQVKANLLKFPVSDDELLSTAMEDLTKNIGESLGELCSNWTQDILARARQAGEDAELEATEDFVLYVVSSHDEPPSDLKTFLKEKHHFTDIEALRGIQAKKSSP